MKTHKETAYLAWKTLPNAPSPISLTYSILFLGYSRLSSFGLRRRGMRWYIGLGCSRSRSSSEGRVVRVGVSDSLKQQSHFWSVCAQPSTRRQLATSSPKLMSFRMEKEGAAGLLKEPCSKVSCHVPNQQATFCSGTGVQQNLHGLPQAKRGVLPLPGVHRTSLLERGKFLFQSIISCTELSSKFYLFLLFHCFR